MITFRCPCGAALKVSDKLAGAAVKCPKCAKKVNVSQAQGVPGTSGCAPVDATVALPTAPSNTPAPAIANTPSAELSRDTVAVTAAKPPGDTALTAFLGPPQNPDEIGRLGPYRVLEVLGAGGMGVVFKAEDPQLKRVVALKVMLPALAASGTFRERFLREARAIASLEHDHIVTIYQVGEDRNVPYLAMQLLQGEPLDARLRREKQLSPREVVRVGREIALGLAAAHARGMIHRDIKPANIWLETKEAGATTKSAAPRQPGRVKILDFGLARAIDEEAHLTQDGAITGTPAYMSPEQIDGKAPDHRCDLFSLGCVLYQMATGQTPFKGATTMSTIKSVALDQPISPRRLNRDMPAPLSALILQLLEKSRADRPQSAQDVVAALEAIDCDKTEVIDVGIEADHPTRRPTPRNKVKAAQGTAPARSPSRGLMVLAGLAFHLGATLIGGGALIGGILWFSAPDGGTLLIQADDPTLQIIVKQGPEVVVKRTALRQFDLKPGRYEIELADANDRWILVNSKITLAPGGTETVRVQARVVENKKPGPIGNPNKKVIAVHDLDRLAYQDWIENLEKDGFRPTYLSAVGVGNQARFSALAVRDGKLVDWWARHNVTPEKFAAYAADYQRKGLRMTCICDYIEGGARCMGGIWVKDDPPGASWHHYDQGPAQLVDNLRAYGQKGAKPLCVTGMYDGASHRFATVFTDEPFARTALYDLTSDQYTQAVADYSKKAYRPISVSSYETAGGPRFATVFSLDNQVKDWEARHGLTVAGYQQLAARLSPAGAYPIVLTAYHWQGEIRYATIWVTE